jgi:hypothetical protein
MSKQDEGDYKDGGDFDDLVKVSHFLTPILWRCILIGGVLIVCFVLFCVFVVLS